MSCNHDETNGRQIPNNRFHFLGHRFIEYTITIAIIVTINFFLPRLLPGDPFSQLTGTMNASDLTFSLDAADETALRQYYGLDEPLWQQFCHYCLNLLHGNLGYAYYYKAPVNDLLAERLPWSLLLLLSGIILAAGAGIAAGAWAAWRRGTLWDRGLWGFIITLRSIPPFFLGSIFLLLFSAQWHWFPIFGAFSVESAYNAGLARIKDIVWHLVLPAATLALCELSGIFLLTRSAMLDTLREDYVILARARGLSERQIMFKHALPNSLLPVATHITLRLGLAASVMIYVEAVFGYPGMGKFMQDALAVRDFQVLQGAFLLMSLMVLTFNLLLDLLYSYLDPRMEVHHE